MLPKNLNFRLLLATIFVAVSSPVFAQLTISPTATAAVLANKLAGSGITIISDTLICNSQANGTFISVSTPISIDSGIILSTGKVTTATGAEPGATSTGFGGSGDADLNSLLGSTTTSRDGCALIINFVPKGDTVSFNYQFGSEEYINSTCGNYNDAFGFFISGPGVSSSLPGVNMALVPGTNIPVTVNSINSGTPCSGCSISTCNAMGSGSPFTAFYIDNYLGTAIAYRGYTRVLTAKHWVRPCDTYRIKMVVADASNTLYDSGVFIEAGSLKTNSYHFDHTNIGNTILGYNNAIVKGCTQDSIRIKSSKRVGTATVMHMTYTGTAIGGTDYTTLPDSVTMNAGDTVVAFPITGIAGSATGPKTLTIFLTNASICGIIDTINITILDKPTVNTTVKDTFTCIGQPVRIAATTSTGLVFGWTPGATLSSTTILNPIATPFATTVYTITAVLPGSLCLPVTDTVRVLAVQPSFSILTPDTTVCQGEQFQIRLAGNSSYYYSWTPATGLNSAGIMNPVATASSTITYSVTATIPGTSCSGTKSFTVTVIPTNFVIATLDTYFCTGATMVLNASVTPPASTYTYAWAGPAGFSSPLLNPIVTTVSLGYAGTYTLTVTNSGLCSGSATEKVIVYPSPSSTMLAPPIELCQYEQAVPLAVPGYSNLMWFSSSDDNTPSVIAPYPRTDSVGIFHYYAAQISYNNNCLSEKTSIDVTVKSCCDGTLFVPSAFTPNQDGINDVLHIVKAPEFVVSEFTVYDRWGRLVFQSSNAKTGWDGTIGGEPADMGTYYYSAVVNCTNSDKKPLNLKGDVILIR